MTEARPLEAVERPPLEPVLSVAASERQRGIRLGAKRAIDIVGATAVLVIMSPVALAIAIAIRLSSRGPAVYQCTRIGHQGAPFTMYKFRSMRADTDDSLHKAYLQRLMHDMEPDADDAEPEMFKLEDDPRVTRVGRWLRRLSLDELPQLINVIKGDMSLVGPRPEVPYVLDIYRPEQFGRFAVLPGMTGLWQVNGRGELPPNEMLRLDVEYAENWSFRLDLSILLRTPAVVFKKIGAR